MAFKNNRAPLLYYVKLFPQFRSHWWIQTRVRVRIRSIWVKIGDFVVPCDLETWWRALKNIMALFLYYVKLCASFQSHRCIQTWATIWAKIGNFLSHVTFKFDGWSWKTIAGLFYAASSFVYHFVAIGEFKLELYSQGTSNLGQNRRFVISV